MRTELFSFALIPHEGAQELYYRNDGFRTENGGLSADKPGASVMFNTYFNLISVGKMRRCCDIFAISCEAIFTGALRFEFFADDGKLLFDGTSGVSVKLDDVPENAEYLYLKLTALSENVWIEKITVLAECKSVRKILPAIVICTYHRERFAKKNATLLAKYLRESGTSGQVIVVDNGRTLTDFFDDRITLIPNANAGGSGGFGKGMEYAAQRGFTHIILMDDDVEFEPISFQKLFGFLKTARNEDISVAGTMLLSDEPSRCFESGGYFDTVSGVQTGFSYGLDMTKPENLYLNEQEKKINYGGWWMFCMPTKYARSGSLPMPFFIKYDDVEYALRCKMNIVTLNGVGVWHERFDGKYNSDSEYYNVRNFLLLRSLHGGISPKEAKKFARWRIREKLCCQQYDMAYAARLGYLDHLKGTAFLENLDAEKNHEKIRKLNYPMLDENTLYEKYGVRFSQEKLDLSQQAAPSLFKKILLYGHLIPNCFCKKDHAVTDVFFDRKEMYFGYKTALHFDSRTGRGYVTKKSLKNFILYKFKRGTK